jgi:exodeoxyribonuclease-1
MQAFHQADWNGRAAIAETFEDDRYTELARRLVFINAPKALSSSKRDQLHTWLNNRRHGHDGVEAGRTISDAIEEVENTSGDGAVPSNAEIQNWLESLG